MRGNFRSNLVRGVLAMFAVSAHLSAFALMRAAEPMDIQQLTRNADEIVVGHVVSEETAVVGNRLQTNYKILVNENLRGRNPDMTSGREFAMTLPGGTLTTPPLAQYVSGMPYMVKGEDVVLFLKKPAPLATSRAVDPAVDGNLRTSYQILGYDQGRFSVITDRKSGRKMVTRLNLENYGLLNTRKDLNSTLDALSQNQIPMVPGNVVRQPGTPAVPADKDPLEATAADVLKLTKEQRKAARENTERIMRMRGVPAQNLDTFREQVVRYAND